MAASSSSSAFFGIRDEDLSNLQQMKQQQQSSSAGPSSSAATTTLPAKKKRNQPGNPNPDAEVIALSPKTLMATNRFICEVCNKGFQREQNLQLHRRGHNLPWKLKQKSTKEVKRRVYLCPEPSCVHHEPSRALGDLTGIKKHFCRKHGEKKWKCDKCPKRYAVQSDWKAHSKTCGTREYRCDCGTLFSRRDSFITHRAFCDALAQESVRLPTGLTSMGTHLYGPNNNMGLALSHGPGPSHQIPSLQEQTHRPSDLVHLGGGGGGGMQFDHLMSTSNLPSFRQGPSSGFFTTQDFNDDNKNNFHGLIHLPDLQAHNNSNNTPSPAAAAAEATFFNLSFFSNNNATTSSGLNTTLMIPDQFDGHGNNGVGNTDQQNHLFAQGNLVGDNNLCSGGVSSLYNTSLSNEPILPQMSATALLQKAAQMGSTTTNNARPSIFQGFGSSSSSTTGNNKPTNDDSNLHDLMNSLASGNTGIFGNNINNSSFNRSLSMMDEVKLQHNLSMASMGGSDRFTRDFLGVGGMVGNVGRGMNPRDQQQHRHEQQQQQHHRIDMIDPEMKSGNSGRSSFQGGSLQ